MTPRPEGETPHVFLSYASADRERVLAIAAELERAGITVWIDETGIAGGANYGPEIAAAIRECGAVLVMCSAAAFASRNVRQEIALVWKHERPLIPLRLELVEPPAELEYWLEASQWIDAIHPEVVTHEEALLGALRRHGFDPKTVDQPRLIPESNLPAPVAGFLGRQRELSELEQLLEESRLVTLVGAGGSGKTRLAIEAGRARAGRQADGVWMVELAAVSEPAFVIPAIAAILGVRDQAGRTLPECIAAYLSPRHVLLVLDNCEHLILECAQVAQRLLSGCPELHLLATSREPLFIPGEAIYRVPTLRVPPDDWAKTGVSISDYESVQLFVKRTAVVRPGFALNSDNAGAVASICRRLDGIPLAIELAAARMKLLTVAQLDERLHDRFHLLTGGTRTALPRHQTLNGLIEWSYSLLSEEERSLFERVSVFRGGWDLEAAEAICADADVIAPDRVLDLLTQLYDKSLILLDESYGEPRFGQLETIREYGLARLVERGLEEQVRERHARYIAELVAIAGPHLGHFGSRDEIIQRTRVLTNYANIRDAFEWLLSHNQAELAGSVAVSLKLFWFLRGELREGLDWVQRVLTHSDELSREAWAAAKASSALHLLGLSDYTGAVEVVQGIDTSMYTADTYYIEGASRLKLGEPLLGERLLRRAGELFHSIGDYSTEAMTLFLIASQRREQGHYSEGRALIDESLQIISSTGQHLHAAWPLLDLALIDIETGSLATAAGHLIEGSALVTAGASIATWAYVAVTASLAVELQRTVEAARLFGAAEALAEQTGAISDLGIVTRSLERLRSELPDAELAPAWRGGRSLGQDRALQEAVEFCRSILVNVESSPDA